MKNSIPPLLVNKYSRTLLIGGVIAIGIHIASIKQDVNQVIKTPTIKTPENKTLEYHLQEVQKHFPNNLYGDEFLEKLSTLDSTILVYEDIIQELDDPIRTEWMNLIEKQNREIEWLASEKNTELQMRKKYIKLREYLAQLLFFIEKNTKKEIQQCRNPNITV